ncbi:MAG: rhomboid family intramembrane serine protease [Chitinophagaceae bacterium]|nr:rhomboid family intramembrane serine protease [Chitinophagaceae bacterium]
MSNFRYTRIENFPPIVKNLIIINVLVFVAQAVLDQQYQLTDKFTLQPIVSGHLKEMLKQNAPSVPIPDFSPYQIFTHMFTHAPFPMFYHILFNMFALWMFGRVLESVWGSKRFLTFYLLCGIGAAVLHLVVQYLRAEYLLLPTVADINQAAFDKQAGALAGVVGASGAVMGVSAAFAYLFPNTELYLFGAFPIKAKWAILGYVLYDLFAGVGGGGDNIAHFAHLGGAITGFIMVLIWNKTNRRTLY